MRVWVIGAGKVGTAALRQLTKNPDIEVFVSDPSPTPEAVQQGVIDKVDIVENVSSVNVNHLARRIRPDLILLSPAASERGVGHVEGGQALTDALNQELAAGCEYPVMLLSLSNSR
jgi:UDP-N-acetylmuramoylalanine-D-glutamate ligase